MILRRSCVALLRFFAYNYDCADAVSLRQQNVGGEYLKTNLKSRKYYLGINGNDNHDN